MIIYTSDWHLSSSQPENRVDSVLDAGLYKVEYILKKAKDLGASIVVGGDIFDVSCPPYTLVNALMELLLKYKVPVYSIIGNHDVEGANFVLDDTAIFTLFKSGLVKRLTTLYDKDSGLYLEGVDYTKEVLKEYTFKNECPQGAKKVLVIHNAIVEKGSDTSPFECVDIKDFKTDADLVLCGHIHQFFAKKANNTVFISPACLVRRSVNERVLNPCYAIIDKKLNVENIVLNKEAEFNIKVKGSKAVLKGLITDTKIEASDIEEAILKSAYSKEVKDFSIKEIKKVRETGE